MLSSSDSSTITFLREAARRDGLVGDMVAMDVDRCVVVAIFSRRASIVCLPVSLIGYKRRYHQLEVHSPSAILLTFHAFHTSYGRL